MGWHCGHETNQIKHSGESAGWHCGHEANQIEYKKFVYGPNLKDSILRSKLNLRTQHDVIICLR